MINPIPTQGSVAPYRSILKIGGTIIDFIHWETSQSGILEAGTFRATVTAKADSWAWWAQQTEILVDVYAGIPPDPQAYSTDDLTQIFTARIDKLDLDVELQRVTLSGRDMTSLLTDNKTTQKWPNLTASQIAQDIATLWGFQSNIQATTGTVGNFYTQDHVKLAKAETYWDILTYLAQREGYQCFVLGRTLYFGNFGAAASLNPYLIEFDGSGAYPISNALRLKFSHDLTLAQDIAVTVRSYHGAHGAVYKATATVDRPAKYIEKDAALAQIIQHYDYTFPGLTQPECALKANTILHSLTEHELKMSANLPFDVILFPWVPVQVTGTGTRWDVTYTPQNIIRKFSKDSISMTAECRTGIPNQTVVLS